MGTKKWIRDYLTFTRKERTGLMAIATILLITFLLPTFLARNNSTSTTTRDTSWFSEMRRLETPPRPDSIPKSSDSRRSPYRPGHFDEDPDEKGPARPARLFYFDPNTLPADGWQSLGIGRRTIRTIENFRSKGGHFYKSDDLRKIYGLSPDDYERLAPYVRITNVNTRHNAGRDHSYATNENLHSRKTPAIVDINTADTSELKSLPGIGSKLASRIVQFRERLGGFVNESQVAEVYGVRDSVFQQIRPYLKTSNPLPRKININTASADELGGHPYLNRPIARSIIAYRSEHGPFSRVEDIRNVMAVTDETYKKLQPYLSVQ